MQYMQESCPFSTRHLCEMDLALLQNPTAVRSESFAVKTPGVASALPKVSVERRAKHRSRYLLQVGSSKKEMDPNKSSASASTSTTATASTTATTTELTIGGTEIDINVGIDASSSDDQQSNGRGNKLHD